jgi:peptidyl-prolyl cis-trans isomerase D
MGFILGSSGGPFMLDFMRRQHSKLKWVWIVVIIILGGGMLVAYIPFGDLGTMAITGGDVAKVGSETVTAAEFKNTYTNYVRNMQQQLTPEIRKAFGFDKQILDYLISQKVIMAEARRLGLQVTENEIQQNIYSNPTFLSDGTFIGKERYEGLLLQNGIKVEDYENAVRSELMAAKILSFVTAGVSVSDKEAEDEYRKRNEKAVLNYFVIDPVKLEAKITLNDQDLKAYYEKNKAKYSVPEKRKSRYAFVDVLKYHMAAKADDTELKSYYDEHAEEYRLPEQITAQHILFKTENKKPEEIEAIRKKATDVVARAKKGEDFGKLAMEFSEGPSAKQGGTLGTIPRGARTPEFDQAAFALGPGAISDLVNAPDGLHIIKVNAKDEGRLRPFEEMKEAIRPIILNNKGKQKAKEVAEQIALELATNKDIHAVAAKHGATVKETPLVEQNQPIPDLGPAATPYQTNVFSLAKDAFGTAIETHNGYVVPQVVEIQPSHPASFDEAKDRVAAEAKSEKARTMATENAAKAQELITAGKTDLATMAKTFGAEPKTSEKLTRGGSIPEFGSIAERDQDIFTLPIGQLGPPTTLGGKTIVFAVKEREQIKPDEMKQALVALRTDILNSKRERYFTAYIKDVQKKMEEAKTISVNETALAQIAESVQ